MHTDNAIKRLLALLVLLALAFAVSGCGDPSVSYEKALELFGQGEFADAAEAFDKLGDYLQAETYALYSQGLTYYQQGSYTEAEPYFEQTQDFMYGAQRYQYCHAYALEEAGEYAEAAQWYTALGDYENAAAAAAYCTARAAQEQGDYETALIGYDEAEGYQDAEERLDVLNFDIYTQATAAMDAKEYETAFKLFTILGERYDATEYARTAKNYMLEDAYAAAEQMIEDGDLQGAYDQFTALAGYRDAATRATELAGELGIDTAAE